MWPRFLDLLLIFLFISSWLLDIVFCINCSTTKYACFTLNLFFLLSAVLYEIPVRTSITDSVKFWAWSIVLASCICAFKLTESKCMFSSNSYPSEKAFLWYTSENIILAFLISLKFLSASWLIASSSIKLPSDFNSSLYSWSLLGKSFSTK